MSVALVLAGAVAGCSSSPDVPFGVRATEVVWCADGDGVVDTVTWEGHEGPLTDLDVQVVGLDAGDVSEEDLLDACARPFRWLASATLCEASTHPDELRGLEDTGFVSERYGEVGEDRPGFPVVVRDRVACEDVELQAGPAAAMAEADGGAIADRLQEWHGTSRFNGWRAREAMWREAADDNCLDLAAARDHALAAQEELDGDWPVFETARAPEDPAHAGLCLDVRLERAGFIEVGYHAVETPGGRSGPVDATTDTAEPDTSTDG